MTDLVERLRDPAHGFDRSSSHADDRYVCVCDHLAAEAADEIERLRDHLSDYDEAHRMTVDDCGSPDEAHCSCVPALRMEIERLQSRVAELEKDAARYQWLRQERYMFREGACVTCDEQAETAALWVKCPNANDAHEVDVAIDADMEEQS